MSFVETSRNYRLEGTTLLAECQDREGQYQNSQLNLNDVLGNNDGEFDLSGTNFGDSANNIRLDNTALVASLQTKDGNWREAAIDLNSFISNEDGSLERV
ncbi:Cyanovirin-N [Mycena galopus ATCC 62051]|nr:Cyanovirin-N [Mycena galopus ATCC 62051]